MDNIELDEITLQPLQFVAQSFPEETEASAGATDEEIDGALAVLREVGLPLTQQHLCIGLGIVRLRQQRAVQNENPSAMSEPDQDQLSDGSNDSLPESPDSDREEALMRTSDDARLMSGMVHPSDRIKRRNSNDHLVCQNDLHVVTEHMPGNVMMPKSIQDLLGDHPVLEQLPWDYRTTMRGVKEAVDASVNIGRNDLLLQYMSDIGGRILHETNVEYPEHISPYTATATAAPVQEYWQDIRNKYDELGPIWAAVGTSGFYEPKEQQGPLTVDTGNTLQTDVFVDEEYVESTGTNPVTQSDLFNDVDELFDSV